MKRTIVASMLQKSSKKLGLKAGTSTKVKAGTSTNFLIQIDPMTAGINRKRDRQAPR